ncbi:MAG: chalcone isomerase family protein [Myxococcota bacterium]
MRTVGIMGFATLLAVSASTADARQRAGVTLPNFVNLGGKKLVLNGLGIREATVFKINVYVAGLYLEKKASDSSAIIMSDQNKQLILHFVRDVDQDDLADAFTEGFEKNGGSALESKVKKLASWMSDVEEGDRIELSYSPGKGTAVHVRGKKKGTVEGKDFARVLFRIFLGPKPPNTSLRVGLLGTG